MLDGGCTTGLPVADVVPEAVLEVAPEVAPVTAKVASILTVKVSVPCIAWSTFRPVTVMPVVLIVTLAVAPPPGVRFTVVWKLPLLALPPVVLVVDCWLLAVVWPPVELPSMRSPSDCELLLDVLLPDVVVVPPVVPEDITLLLVEPPDALLFELELPEVLPPDVDEPEFVLFMLEEPDVAFPVIELPVELPLFIELLLDVLLAAEPALVPELLEAPTIV